MRSKYLTTVTWLLLPILLFSWAGLPQFAAAQQQQPLNREEAAKRLEDLFDALEVLANEIPRDTFEPQAIVDEVGKDPVALFEWVRDNTYLVPYRGTLRGPVGVLMDRRGNSVDRALLLSELLRVAGYDARLARGRLPREQADALLRQSPESLAVPGQAGPIGGDGIDQLLSRYSATDAGHSSTRLAHFLDRVRIQRETIAEEVAERVSEQHSAILALLDTAAPSITKKARLQSIETVRDHWWVQCNAGGRWIDMDPTSEGPGEVAGDIQGTLADPMADSDLVHEVTIGLVVERWHDGALTTHEVLRKSFPASGAAGQQLAIKHFPLDWSDAADFQTANVLAQLERLLPDLEIWLPVLFIGTDIHVGTSFNVAGQLLPPTSAGPTDSLPSAGTAMGGFGGAIAGVEESPEEPVDHDSHLTAEWVEYEIRVPGESTRKIRRQIFDLLPPGSRTDRGVPAAQLNIAELNRSFALLRHVEVLIQTSYSTPQRLARHLVESKAASINSLIQALRADRASDDLLLTLGLSSPRPQHTLALARTAWNPRANKTFIASPNVLAYYTGVRRDDTGQLLQYQALDIVQNNIAVLPNAGESFSQRVWQGVVDTNAEHFLLGITGAVSAAEAFQRIDVQGIGWRVIDAQFWGELGARQEWLRARSSIQGALADGYVILAPADQIRVGTEPVAVWWRIDPKSGETLGMTGDGIGGGIEEHVIMRSKAAEKVYRAMVIQQRIAQSSLLGGGWALFNILARCKPGDVHCTVCSVLKGAEFAVGFGSLFIGLSKILAVLAFGAERVLDFIC